LLQDFPFLRDLKFRKTAIQMENGEMVAVCLDCFENLRNQVSRKKKDQGCQIFLRKKYQNGKKYTKCP
jgi:hypothetical protein